jgi:hypothetical protein
MSLTAFYTSALKLSEDPCPASPVPLTSKRPVEDGLSASNKKPCIEPGDNDIDGAMDTTPLSASITSSNATPPPAPHPEQHRITIPSSTTLHKLSSSLAISNKPRNPTGKMTASTSGSQTHSAAVSTRSSPATGTPPLSERSNQIPVPLAPHTASFVSPPPRSPDLSPPVPAASSSQQSLKDKATAQKPLALGSVSLAIQANTKALFPYSRDQDLEHNNKNHAHDVDNMGSPLSFFTDNDGNGDYQEDGSVSRCNPRALHLLTFSTSLDCQMTMIWTSRHQTHPPKLRRCVCSISFLILVIHGFQARGNTHSLKAKACPLIRLHGVSTDHCQTQLTKDDDWDFFEDAEERDPPTKVRGTLTLLTLVCTDL